MRRVRKPRIAAAVLLLAAGLVTVPASSPAGSMFEAQGGARDCEPRSYPSAGSPATASASAARPGRERRRPASPPERIVVRVFVHVLRSESRGPVAPARIRAQLRVINRAYAGMQSPHAASAPFHFHLVSTDVTVNGAWYRMGPGTVAERRAKRALRLGGRAALNLYIGANDEGLLGWTTQPEEYDGDPSLDGVVVARHTLPGGRGGQYSFGDAAVHESGHWLGLLHTFAGRCGRRGDLVADTPAEARPSYACVVERDTCSSPGNDPVHNFMDYGFDRCMDRFTPGQVRRMTRMWSQYREYSRERTGPGQRARAGGTGPS